MTIIVTLAAETPISDAALKQQLAQLPEAIFCVVGETQRNFQSLLKTTDWLVNIPVNPTLKHMSPHRAAAYSFYLWLAQQKEVKQVFLFDHGGVGYYALQARHAQGTFEEISFALWMCTPTLHYRLTQAEPFNSISLLEAHFMEQRCYALVEECEFLAKELEDYPQQQHWKREADVVALTGTPKISVCITHYNRPQMLQEAVQSIQNQTYGNIEMIVVDDGSTDEAVEKTLRALEAKGVRVIVQENKYLGAARNTGAKAATGEYILFMDDDNLAMPQEVATLVKVAQRTQADVVTTAMRIFETSPEKEQWIFCPLGGDVQSGFFSNVFGDANALWKKSTFNTLGGFTEDYGVGYEDWELFSKAVLKGYRLEICPEAGFYYRELPTLMSTKTPFYKNHYRALRPFTQAHLEQQPMLTLAQGIFLEAAVQAKEIQSAYKAAKQMEQKYQSADKAAKQMEQKHRVLQYELQNVVQEYKTAMYTVNAVLSSTSWRVTAPLRKLMILLRSARKLLVPGNYKTAFNIWREHGFLGLRGMVTTFCVGRHSGNEQRNYSEWIMRYETLNPEKRKKIEERIQIFEKPPLISVVMPVYNVEEKWLRLAVKSVQEQVYPYWELCIADDASPAPHIRPLLEQLMQEDARIKVIFREKNGHISESSNSALSLAKGEFVALMDHDDLLSPDALFRVAEAINQHPDVMMLYSDEDKIDTEGNRYSAYFKSDWNTDLFYAQNMFSHLGVYRRSLIEKVGGFRKGFEGSQDYDLALRCLEQINEEQIHHIPRVLYHWRSIPGSTSIALNEKSYAGTAAQKALYEHFARKYPKQNINLAPTFIPGSLRVVWPLPEKLPLVSLIIPTRNGLDILSLCIASILKKTRYVNYEILIVDNQSDDPKTLEYFDAIQQKEARIRVVKYDHPFNYSAINNFAVEQTKGDIIGLINNDIEAMNGADEERCWLTEMVSHVVRPEVGAVGAKLYYPNGTVQHGGVLTGLGGGAHHAVAGHLFVGLTKNDAGYFARGIVTQQLSAVTAACMLMRREVFEEVGGLDVENLPVAFNDVDLCLKIRKAGYKIIWTPFAELIHHESISRGKEDTPEKKARALKEILFMRNKWGDFLLNDPFYNPNLNYIRGDFALAFPPRTAP